MFKGRKNRLVELERKIRPYRHAFIRIIRPVGGPFSYEYANGINEFDKDLITSIVDDSGGIYVFTIDTALFKNIDNVIQESDIIHTSIPNLPLVSSTFLDSTKAQLQINVFDFIGAVTVDIDGEILLVIKEFYE